jgi:hypothetical protein
VRKTYSYGNRRNLPGALRNCTAVRVPSGIILVPRPGLVHQATASCSMSPISDSGSGALQRQKSDERGIRVRVYSRVGIRTINSVDECCLALGCRAFGGRIANVVSRLRSANTVVGVYLVRLGEM